MIDYMSRAETAEEKVRQMSSDIRDLESRVALLTAHNKLLTQEIESLRKYEKARNGGQ